MEPRGYKTQKRSVFEIFTRWGKGWATPAITHNDLSRQNPISPKTFYALWVSSSIAGIFFLALWTIFDPLWMTNDEVGASMFAHGYGAFAEGSARMLYSNVLWGYLIRSIPELNGVLGYSTATLGALVVCGTLIIFSLLQLRMGALMALLVMSAIMLLPAIAPQFTINAGLLTMSGFICLLIYSEKSLKSILLLGMILSCLGALIRFDQFLLIGLLGLPIVFQQKILKDPYAIKVGFALISLITVAIAIDNWHFHQPQWAEWKSFQHDRAILMHNINLDELAENQPKLFEKIGVSKNDVKLVKNWFHVDLNLFGLRELLPIQSEWSFTDYVARGGQSLIAVAVDSDSRIFLSPLFFPSIFLTIVLFFTIPVGALARLALMWCNFFLLVALIGILFRTPPLRVLFSMIAFLFFFVVWEYVRLAQKFDLRIAVTTAADGPNGRPAPRYRSLRTRLLYLLAPAFLINCWQVLSWHTPRQLRSDLYQESVKVLPRTTLIDWGGNFKVELAYKVLRNPREIYNLRTIALGTGYWAANAVAMLESKNGRGLKDKLIRGEAITVVGNRYLELLSGYCREHVFPIYDFSDIQFENYVDSWQDLADFYNKNYANSGISKAEFGRDHFLTFGLMEGRRAGLVAPGKDLITISTRKIGVITLTTVACGYDPSLTYFEP